MATTIKRPGKEKRGTISASPSSSPSPSPSNNAINKKSSKPITSTRTTPTSSCDHERPTTPTNPKPIPNYLKPTISSLPKRSNPNSSALAHTLRPSLSKVRSFDKGHQVSKPVRGSTTTTTTTTNNNNTGPNKETNKTVRSSSFSSIPLISSDNRNKNASKLLKRTSSYNTSSNKKDKASTSSTKKPPKSVGIANETHQFVENDQLGTIDHHHDMIIIDDVDDQELQSLPEISEMLDQELGDPTTDIEEFEQKDHDHDHKGEVEQQEITTIEESHDDNNDHEKIDHEKSTDEEHVHPTTEEIIVVEEQTEDDKVEQGAGEEPRPDQEVGPSEKLSEEREEEVKTETGKKKKENQQAYNDVIEETSRKLMEKKNKVRALAGAFETVISLQDKSPSKH